jgi:hypothetical protein
MKELPGMTSQLGNEARQVAESGPIRLLGRVGLVAYGVVHLLVGYLALKVAIDGGGEQTDKSGALKTLAEQPGGKFLLWVIAVGLAALVLWQIAEALWGHRGVQPARKRNRKRAVNAGQAVIFGFLAASAARLASGGGSGSGDGQKTLTATMLSWPGGQFLVGAIGVAVMVIAGFVIHHGLTKKFTEDLDLSRASDSARKTAIRLGQVGYPALGVAYGIVGLLVVVAAVEYDPEESAGLDNALKTLAGQPYGAVLLGIVAVGLACFGAYCLFDARYRKG